MTTKSDQRKFEPTSATALTQYGLQSNHDIAHVRKATTWIRKPRWKVSRKMGAQALAFALLVLGNTQGKQET